jgi:hypothetical protein
MHGNVMMVNLKIVAIGPEIAQELLDKDDGRGGYQRKLMGDRMVNPFGGPKEKLVELLAKSMNSNKWINGGGDPIRVADDGTIIDGTHRLWAVIKSGKTLEFQFIDGLGGNNG